MELKKKQHLKQEPAMGTGLETLPTCMLVTAILLKLELETLCSLACISTSMNSPVSEALPSLSSLNLAAFCPNAQILRGIVGRCAGVSSLTLNCLLLNDESLECFLGRNLQELNLLCCSLMSYQFFMPKTLKSIELQPVLVGDVINNYFPTAVVSARLSTPVSRSSFGFAMQRLSLVLDVISDKLIIIISICDNLVELDLEDRPVQEPLPNQDLTHVGLLILVVSSRLKGLSLVRSRQNCQVSFKGVDDIGMFILKCCTALESVRLCGFSRVSDAGYASVLQSCPNLKKFEVCNVKLLTDLTFVDLTRFSCSLVELTSSGVLEVLDLYGCRSIADSCLVSIASLHSLTMLNLSGADISDHGLSVLGKGTPPITHLCLRNCKGVTDEGVLLLFLGGTIGKTLSSLDLGHIPGISDKAVHTIAVAGTEITELLLKRPFFPGLYWLGVGNTRLNS
ncbi:hypothetical protein ACLB2K_030312 [Fragaria x ananassa]